ncbi:winged helix-turn-helix transcriptional regulator [Alicyclobacillus shizuokensis]|uniref:winged helix-turn-helix transcriptional regulator n=1 Tax=Alicyclobacillus shizuokensis TaxID=392014 RepID=UPI00082C64DA|nr:helix-turn-helix domain-containing protein [Alicyclobacillus shizuokensis]MCL6626317.1 helix-turn-helix transcriptional regulator [Alicyclobacillus shizuokensis]
MQSTNPRPSDIDSIPCSIEKALTIIGGKWSFLVLKELYTGTKRFSELQRALPGVSPKALTDTLRHLESHGILERKVYPTVPVTVEYTLTEKGNDFHGVLREMKRWGAKWG